MNCLKRLSSSVLLFELLVVFSVVFARPAFCELKQNLFDVQIVGHNIWMTGYRGTILYSNDRGNTWTSQESGTKESILDICFINEKKGWAVGSNGLIIHTEDKGKTWDLQKSPLEEMLLSVFFIDERTGWICGPQGTIIKTVDGGKTWNDLPSLMLFDFYSVYFLDKANGWVAGEFGIIYRTTDGGKSWVKQKNPAEISYLTGCQQCIFRMILDGEAGMGYVFFMNGGLLVSDNRGESWKKVSTNINEHFFNGVVFDNKLWVVGQRGTLVVFDHGKTELIDIPSKMDLLQIAFSTDGYGLIVGCHGFLMRSLDNGKTWNRIPVKITK